MLNKLIQEVIEKDIESYLSLLKKFTQFTDQFDKISEELWLNKFFPPLDAISLISFVSLNKPKIYLEIGSGNSTKFIFESKQLNNLKTEIISIDPKPRVEIDLLCDRIIREPLEYCSVDLFSQLSENDILFIDGSHYLFQDSDVKFFFFEVLPRVNPGVLIHLHDIFLPYDYPSDWSSRRYNEQYLLGLLLLFSPEKFKVILPNFYLYKNSNLDEIFVELKQKPTFSSTRLNGGSFWFTKT